MPVTEYSEDVHFVYFCLVMYIPCTLLPVYFHYLFVSTCSSSDV